ncbi:acylneuraminate cytidylyltransferase family protein [Planktomarina temperata]|nr:acylneuraminate cytidylyltransferase family protein [Planktomarina temperata]
MRLHALIPARSGSKGVKGKNYKNLAGKPLISWTIDAAISSEVFSSITVSTNCSKVTEICRSYPIKTLLRPDLICGDNSTALEYILHYINAYSLNDNDIIVLLQPTSPLRDSNCIKEAYKNFISSQKNTLVSVEKVPHTHHPEHLYNVYGHITEINYSGEGLRQKSNCYYARNGAAIYMFTVELAKKGILIDHDSVALFEMHKADSIDINDQFDFDIADFLMKQRNYADSH